MTIQLRKAERLCTAAEFNLVKAAVAPAIRELAPKQLAAHVTRARRARDKQRDLLKRQRLDSRERTGQKSGRSGDANARTREKAELFGEVLERFEARVKVVEAGAAREARGMTGKKTAKKKKVAKTGSVKEAATNKLAGAQAASKKSASKKSATKKAATKQAATTKDTTKKAVGKKAAGKNAATKDSTAKKSSKRPTANERDERPVVKTPTERVAEKVRNHLQRPDDHPSSGVERHAIDPGVTDTQGARFVSDRAKIAAQQAGSHGAREQAIQGHVSSTGRKNQAKRDKR